MEVDEKVSEPYTVDALVSRMGFKANSKLWKGLDTVVRVQGRVSRVTLHKNGVYFDLNGPYATIRILVDSAFTPKEGAHIVIEGMPIFEIARFGVGLEIKIHATVVSNVSVTNPIRDDPQKHNIDKTRHVRLYDWLRSGNLNQFCILGSETAITDVISQIESRELDNIRKNVIVVSDKNKILRSVRNLGSECSAFAIVRGGDDDTMKIWDDPELVQGLVRVKKPFFLALGHTHTKTLASVYADEAFPTPNAFGSSFNSIIRQLTNESNLTIERNKYAQVEQQLADLRIIHKSQIKDLHDQYERVHEKQQESKPNYVVWLLFGVLVLVLVLLLSK